MTYQVNRVCMACGTRFSYDGPSTEGCPEQMCPVCTPKKSKAKKVKK